MNTSNMAHRDNKKPVYLALALTFIFLLFTGWVYTPHGACFETGSEVKSLGLLWAYDADTVVAFFAAMNPTQLACYREFLQIWDMAFAALYGVFYASWIGVLFRQRRLIWLLPVFAAVLLDWTENGLEIQMIRQFMSTGQPSAVFVDLGSALNSIKWVAMSAIFVALVIGLISRLRAKA